MFFNYSTGEPFNPLKSSTMVTSESLQQFGRIIDDADDDDDGNQIGVPVKKQSSDGREYDKFMKQNHDSEVR